MRKAIVAIEDSRFYQHGAIDVRGTLRAIVNDLEHKQVQGGSTLTQQYVKNALILTAPNPQMAEQATSETLSRKIKELRLAIDVEGKMTQGPDPGGLPQRRVLRHLLRQPGGRRRGRRRAVLRHHRGQADPARRRPCWPGWWRTRRSTIPSPTPTAAIKRRNVVLARMAQLHIITQARAVAVGKQGLGLHLSPLQTGCTSGSARSAAFFCDYVVSLLKQDNAFSQAWNTLNTIGGPEDLHHAEPAGRARGQAGGELHGAAAAQRGQPGR